jgi:hypothetical protein
MTHPGLKGVRVVLTSFEEHCDNLIKLSARLDKAEKRRDRKAMRAGERKLEKALRQSGFRL